jgi:twinkle protein
VRPDDEQFDDGLSSAVLSKENDCPRCGKDNLVIYLDGHSHCFTQGCGYHTPADHQHEDKVPTTPAAPPAKPVKLITPDEISTPTSAYRGLKPATLKRFEYGRARFGRDKKEVDVWPIYNQDGSLWGQRIRHLDKKDFTVLQGPDAIGSINDTQPFGKTVWGDANDKRVVVMGGEIDIMSLAQVSTFKYPVVTSNSGEGATAAMLKANYKWFDRFDEIILWLDDDETGRNSMQECAPLFAIGKVKIAKMAGFKDGNEALIAGKFAEMEQAIYAAVAWVPRGIINAADTKADLKKVGDKPKFWHIPFPGLQEMTGGLGRAQTSFWVAGTGIGKTTALQETLVHLHQHPEASTEDPIHIGYLGFEDLRLTVQLDFMSIIARQRLKLDPLPLEELERLHDLLFADRRFELFDVENAEWTFKAVMSYIRYMVKALGVNFVVLDPLSFLVAMLEGHLDERKALDAVSQQLAALSKELNVHIAVTHHLTRPAEGPGHEEGGRVSLRQVRGSGGVAMFASFVIGAERNQQHDNDEAKLITLWRVLKNRPKSTTGVASYTIYNLATGETKEMPKEQAMALLGGKPASNKESEHADWADANDGDF